MTQEGDNIEVPQADLLPEGEAPVVETPTQTPDEPQYSDVERRAMEQGWKPKDQWDGDPNEHRSAREFLDRGELLGALAATKKQVKELTNQVRFMSEHQRKVHEAAYTQALKDLRAAKAEAVARGDGEAVVELDDQIDEHRQAIQTIKRAPAPPQEDPEASPIFEQWLTNNAWYKTDKSKKIWADAVAVDLASTKAKRGEQLTEKELYDYLHDEYRRTFSPEQKRANTPARPPSPDGSGRQSGGKAKVGNNASNTPNAQLQQLLNDMPQNDRRAVEDMIRSGWVTAEQFVKDFDLVKNKWER